MSDAAEASAVQQRNSQLQESLPYLELVSGGRFRPGSTEPESPNSGNPGRPESMTNMSQANASNIRALEGAVPEHFGQMPISNVKDFLHHNDWEDVKAGANALETAKLQEAMMNVVLQDGIDTGDTETIGKAARMVGDGRLEAFAKNMEERLKKENPDASVKVVDGQLVIYNPKTSTALEINPATGSGVTRPASTDSSGNTMVDHSKSVMVDSKDTFAHIMKRYKVDLPFGKPGTIFPNHL